MTGVERITPAEARQKTQSCAALLVLACESEELCRSIGWRAPFHCSNQLPRRPRGQEPGDYIPVCCT